MPNIVITPSRTWTTTKLIQIQPGMDRGASSLVFTRGKEARHPPPQRVRLLTLARRGENERLKVRWAEEISPLARLQSLKRVARAAGRGSREHRGNLARD